MESRQRSGRRRSSCFPDNNRVSLVVLRGRGDREWLRGKGRAYMAMMPKMMTEEKMLPMPKAMLKMMLNMPSPVTVSAAVPASIMHHSTTVAIAQREE